MVPCNQLPSSSAQDHTAKLQLCSKYLENLARANEKDKVNTELLIDLLVNMREIIMMDHMVGSIMVLYVVVELQLFCHTSNA